MNDQHATIRDLLPQTLDELEAFTLRKSKQIIALLDSEQNGAGTDHCATIREALDQLSEGHEWEAKRILTALLAALEAERPSVVKGE